jgi:hypothetical protein
MERVCIFCGERPASKTLEHVLPQWLIALTGNPKRMAYFGDAYLEGGQFVKRKFAFDAFKFPSCKECNRKFAELEEDVKVTVQKMMSEDLLSESELSRLLDWFDKVRIGLWLGYLYLDKNPLGISPHFHIQNRIKQNDRILAIFRASGDKEGLSFTGCDTPAFALTPSCFSLRINSLCFLNISYNDLLARRMGFPFPAETYYMEDGRLFCKFKRGRNRIMKPVLKKSIRMQGTELYQPIFFGNMSAEGFERAKELFDTKYVRGNCMSWEKGIGKVFIKRNSGITVYSASPSKEWVPERIYDSNELQFEMQLLVLEWQLYIQNNLGPSSELLPREKKGEYIRSHDLAKNYNKRAIELLKKLRGMSAMS